MELSIQASGMGIVGVGQVVMVLGIVCPPVQGGSKGIDSSRRIRFIISSGFHDVDLTGSGPHAVSLIGGKHPDGRPDPISSGKFGADLHSSVFEIERVY